MKEFNYKIGIHKLLKMIHPDSQLSNATLLLINNMILRLAYRLIRASNKILNSVNKKLLSVADISAAVKIIYGDELAKQALIDGNKAITKYKNSKKIKLAKENHAGLKFKISTTYSLIKKHINKDNSVFEDATIFLTAVLEYITAEILDLSGSLARENKKIQITPRDIFITIENDSELNNMFKGYFLGTGVIPDINDELLKGGARPPFKKIIKDSIFGITKPGLQRLMYRAGVKYISGIIYEESRFIIKQFLEKILYNTIILAERKNHTTVTYEDGVEALKFLNISIYNAKGYPGTMAPCKGSEKISKLFSNKIKNKKRKHKPKTNLLRIIKKYQSTSCTLLPHESIDKLVREIGNDYSTTIIRYESNYMWLLHAIVEDYMINLYSKALLLALHSNRLTLYPKDIRLVQRINEL